MTNDICKVPDCSKQRTPKRAGFCYGHYMKNWRHGTPTPTPAQRGVDLTGQRFGQLVAQHREGRAWICVCDCGATTTVLVGDLTRLTTRTCGDRKTHRRTDSINYGSAHDRVSSDRGPAKDRQCVGCGQQARHWSYDHDDPDELLDHMVSRNPVTYSLKPEHYSPRCARCHKRFDRDRHDSHAA